MLTETELLREAAATGFQPEILDKVMWLVELLEGLCRHPFLKTRVALKGGTALNLFIFDIPRLSVDIDLNYIGAADRENMLDERPKLDRAVRAVCQRLHLEVKHETVAKHAGKKWRLAYKGQTGRSGTLELDMNFTMRVPLWPLMTSSSRAVGPFKAHQVPVLDVHELAAGKLAALFERNKSRDLFDVRELLRHDLDWARLRLAFVVYGGTKARDWRTVSCNDISAEPSEVNRQLVPVLRADVHHRTVRSMRGAGNSRGSAESWWLSCYPSKTTSVLSSTS